MKNKSNTSWVLILLSFIVSCSGIVVAAAMTILALWGIPPDTPIRPMEFAFRLIVLSGATAILGTALGILALFFVHWRWKLICLSILAILCSYMPMHVANVIFDWIVAHHHLILEG